MSGIPLNSRAMSYKNYICLAKPKGEAGIYEAVVHTEFVEGRYIQLEVPIVFSCSLNDLQSTFENLINAY